MREAPLTGLGYYAASRVYAPEYNPGLGNAHSVFFEVLVGGGILGAALYLVLCGRWSGLPCACCGLPGGDRARSLQPDCSPSPYSLDSPRQSALHAGPLGFAFWSLTALLPGLSREAARARIAGDQRLHARKSSLRSAGIVRSWPCATVLSGVSLLTCSSPRLGRRSYHDEEECQHRAIVAAADLRTSRILWRH